MSTKSSCDSNKQPTQHGSPLVVSGRNKTFQTFPFHRLPRSRRPGFHSSFVHSPVRAL